MPRSPSDEESEEIDEEIDALSSGSVTSSAGSNGISAPTGNPSASGATTSGPGGLPGDTQLQVTPKRGTIAAKKIVGMHDVDEDFKNELADDMIENGYDDDYPVLSVDYENGTSTLLDGHHRGHAAKSIGMKRIPALKIKSEDLRPLLDARFGGKMPGNLSDLDKYIMVDGKPYSKLRATNDHTNGSKIQSGPVTSAPPASKAGLNGSQSGRGVLSGRR